MTHGWGSCQGEGRQGHTGQGQADRGRQEEVGRAEEGGAKLVTEQGRRKQERDGRREGNTTSNSNDSKHFEY